MFLLTGAGSAKAQTTWTGGTGAWATSGNWSAGVPTNASAFSINNGGTAQITAGISGQATGATLGNASGQSGTVTLASATGTLTLSDTLLVGNGGDGNVTITDGTVSGTSAVIGAQAGSSGLVTMNYGNGTTSWLNTGTITIGQSGSGTLYLLGGSVTASSIRIADQAGSSGNLIAYGATITTSQISKGAGSSNVIFDGTTVRLTGDQSALFTGFDSISSTVANGLTIDTQSYDVQVATTITGSGILVKSGSGSLTLTGTQTYTGQTWLDAGTLNIGSTTTLTGSSLRVNGTLNLAGSVNGDYGAIGQGSTGLVTMTGGSWTTKNFLEVGFLSKGTLNMSAGTVFSKDYITVGDTSGTVGDITMTGGLLKSTNALNISSEGTGTVTASGDAQIQTGSIILGKQGGTGTLKLSGTTVVNTGLSSIGSAAGNLSTAEFSGTSWTSTDELRVGDSGKGKLTISAGTVSNTIGNVGRSVGSTGTVIMTGGSWINSDLLTVGNGGTGSLTLSGGTLSNTDASIGRLIGSVGQVTVNGGTWTSTGTLYLGQYDSGNGTLTQSAGAISANTVILANAAAAKGNLNLNGGQLTTSQVSEGPGAGKVTFNGGTLRLSSDQAALFSGFETGDVTFAAGGGIIDTNTHAVGITTTLSGVGGLTKKGSGMLTLTGLHSYSGDTFVNAGTLRASGALTASTVNVQSGGTLDGAGYVANITVESGGRLAPGDDSGLGTLHSGSLTWNAGGQLVFELGAGESDQLSLADAFLKSGNGTFNFTFQGSDWQVGHTYTLIEFESTDFNEQDFGFTNGGPFDGIFTLNDGNLEFTLTAVPEPSTSALAMAGLALMTATLARRPRGKKQ